MDEEDGGQKRDSSSSFEKISLITHTDEEDSDSRDAIPRNRKIVSSFDANTVSVDYDDAEQIGSPGDDDPVCARLQQQQAALRPPPKRRTIRDMFHRTLMPDQGIQIQGYPVVEGSFTIKLLKFILWTFLLTAIIHVIVGKLFSDRDKSLQLWHIWVFDGELMVRDTVVFFLVGRMWQKQGIDHIAFIGTALLANMYFEAQNFVPFLQHSVTLYQMHCVWPWTLWLFVIILIPSIGALVVAHVLRAHRERLLPMKLMELALCFFFFVAPLVPSNYFHLHHWYAGWLIGMHANFDVWWSQFAMAWCWGMYMNGIAVYGRDPVLTCEYAYFLTVDNHCPYVNCYLEALKEMREHPQNHTQNVEMVPANWMNCSSVGYIP
ncbi:hypothetical protein IV203_029847 [Nitzschia inconspicua]|uniref:Transmembrane protein n=1 Tax=Nitzschia inconspicua TaxID=303405 RepID=A0A9K3LRT5_9STRA|nr:hypothetical protein IV203_029847 [Nitzschia inconspicua]